jgi:hypothetical protein
MNSDIISHPLRASDKAGISSRRLYDGRQLFLACVDGSQRLGAACLKPSASDLRDSSPVAHRPAIRVFALRWLSFVVRAHSWSSIVDCMRASYLIRCVYFT